MGLSLCCRSFGQTLLHYKHKSRAWHVVSLSANEERYSDAMYEPLRLCGRRAQLHQIPALPRAGSPSTDGSNAQMCESICMPFQATTWPSIITVAVGQEHPEGLALLRCGLVYVISRREAMDFDDSPLLQLPHVRSSAKCLHAVVLVCGS